MFSNFKQKLSNALQEGLVIKDSLQQQYFQRSNRRSSNSSASASVITTPTGNNNWRFSGIPTFSSSTTTINICGNEVKLPLEQLDLTAGCALLGKYEQEWQAISQMNDSNGKRADAIAQQIDGMQKRTAKQHQEMRDLIACLNELPTLVKKLNTTMQTLQEVTALSDMAEERLEQLEDLCEQCQLQEYMLQKNYELSQHKQTKMAGLETYRQKLAAEHEQKLKQQEERWKQLQRERQAVFDDAFRSDLEEFKQKGALPKLASKRPTQKLNLEEVVLEDVDNKDALENFLNG